MLHLDRVLVKTAECTDVHLPPKGGETSKSDGAQWKGLARPVMPQPFISRPTLKALRITIKSIIDLVDVFLGPEFQFDYVLTGKLNQDSLEVR